MTDWMQAQRADHSPHPESVTDARGALSARVVSRRPLRSAATAEIGILLLDSDAPTSDALARMLRQLGYAVTPACSDAEAAAWLPRRTFDVVLCKLGVGMESRVDLVNEIGDQYSETALMLTVEPLALDMARELAHERGIDVIVMPFTQGELAMAVQRALTRRTLQQRHAHRYKMAMEQSHESVLDALLSTLNTRDTEPAGHAERVTAYTMELADRLALPASQVYHIERGALLHDIGNVGISDRILRKPGRLTPEELTEIRKHPVIGHQMCVAIEQLAPASQIVRHHHERWDGAGYPDGLAGSAIPMGARMFAVADTLDAMTTDRPYRAAVPIAAARAEILRNSGSQFDPAVVRAFEAVPDARWHFIRTHAAR